MYILPSFGGEPLSRYLQEWSAREGVEGQLATLSDRARDERNSELTRTNR
jgi:hypothetical protein